MKEHWKIIIQLVYCSCPAKNKHNSACAGDEGGMQERYALIYDFLQGNIIQTCDSTSISNRLHPPESSSYIFHDCLIAITILIRVWFMYI